MKGHVYRRCPRPLAKACEVNRCGHSYAFTFSHGVDEQGRRRQFTRSGFRTRAEAEKAQRRAITDAEKGVLLSRHEQRAADHAAAAERAAAVTVGAYLQRWLVEQRSALRPATWTGYETTVRRHVAPRIGGIPLRDLTPVDVRRLLVDLAAPYGDPPKARKPATLARVRATLTSAFRAAVADELIPRNPATGVALPKQAGDGGGHSIVVWTPQQLGAFLAAVADDPLYPLLHLAANTGARRGELLGLVWSDIDLTAGLMHVRRTISHRNGKVLVAPPKTKAGERTVALDRGTVDVLKRHRIAQASERLAWAGARDDGDRVFCWPDGRPLRGDYVTRRFEALAAAAGLPVIRFHDLRHSHASAALAAGVPVKVVSDRLGHSSTAITENIYQHVVPQVAADAAELIAALSRAGASNPASNGGS